MSNQLQQICLDKAEQIASEINGDLYYVPQEDIDQLLSQLTEDNVDEIASELAELAHWFNWTFMTWYLQIQDKDNNVLLLNHALGDYKKYSKFIDNKANKVVAQFPTAKRWEVRPNPYTHKAIIWCKKHSKSSSGKTLTVTKLKLF